MSRNIVVCCDGSSNEFAKHNTNVVKLRAGSSEQRRAADSQTGQEKHRMNRHRRRTIAPRSPVHVAAKQRSAGYCKRLPDDVVSEDDLTSETDGRALSAKAA
jgi:hypothetical protein